MDARAGESMYLYEKVTLFIFYVLLLLRPYFSAYKWQEKEKRKNIGFTVIITIE